MLKTGRIYLKHGIVQFCEKVNQIMTNKIKLENLTYYYRDKKAVDNISLSLHSGKFLTILGPSGCGKTTVLKLIGGYLSPTKGSIFIDDIDITSTIACSRKIGMVFQNYVLFPHFSARKNIAFPLEIRKLPKNECEKKVDAISELIGLTQKEIERKPSELSGGQQQRVALARALVFEPHLLLLDEPLANLDKELKTKLRSEIRRLQKDIKITTIMVTHDHEEALPNSDLIGVMDHGKLMEVNDPKIIYDNPHSVFVANFLGETNIIPANFLNISRNGMAHIRPEKIKIGTYATDCNWKKNGIITSITFMGTDFLIDLKTTEGFHFKILSREPPLSTIGSTITIGIETEAIWLIPDNLKDLK
jgi:ABC-type Fe3+/spermidine/putrescine transport system ATPase subunit